MGVPLEPADLEITHIHLYILQTTSICLDLGEGFSTPIWVMMGRYVVLTVLLLNPALVLGGLAKVEEVPLTPEELARVSSLKQVTKVTKEAEEADTAILVKGDQGKVTKENKEAEAEAAILVKGEQGRPCILKPDLEGGWKKLCAVFWLPGGDTYYSLSS